MRSYLTERYLRRDADAARRLLGEAEDILNSLSERLFWRDWDAEWSPDGPPELPEVLDVEDVIGA